MSRGGKLGCPYHCLGAPLLFTLGIRTLQRALALAAASVAVSRKSLSTPSAVSAHAA